MTKYIEESTINNEGKAIRIMFKTILNDQKGSFIVEASIIFPIVFVVTMIMITLAIMLHDTYVTELTSEVLIESTPDISNAELIAKTKSRTIITTALIDINATRLNKNNVYYKIEYSTSILDGSTSQKKIFINAERNDPLQKLRMIDLAGDIIDSIALPKMIKEGHEKALESVFTALKYD